MMSSSDGRMSKLKAREAPLGRGLRRAETLDQPSRMKPDPYIHECLPVRAAEIVETDQVNHFPISSNRDASSRQRCNEK